MGVKVIVGLALCYAAEVASAVDAVSSRFALDLHYESSGEEFPGGDGTEVFGLSSRWTAQTAIWKVDSDGDGLPDWYERLYGLDCMVANAHLDPDGDGRTNLQEYNAGTNPMIADDWTKACAVTDDPFVTDTKVYYTGGNPDFDETFAVIRVSDGFICDTGGLYYDWDGDGIPNWWEKRFARDGSKTGLVAHDDDDRDGLDNYGEFIAYTDPTDAKSKFVLSFASTTVKPMLKTSGKLMLSAAKSVPALQGSAAFVLYWQSAKGRIYSIWRTDDLSKGWGSNPIAEISGTDAEVEYQIDFADAKAGFFKVSVRLSDDY